MQRIASKLKTLTGTNKQPSKKQQHQQPQQAQQSTLISVPLDFMSPPPTPAPFNSQKSEPPTPPQKGSKTRDPYRYVEPWPWHLLTIKNEHSLTFVSSLANNNVSNLVNFKI